MRELRDKITFQSNKSSSIQYLCGSMQGWRPNMEDSHICAIQSIGMGISLFAVFDGHGGDQVSKYLKQYFIQVLTQQPQFGLGSYEKALENTFYTLDSKLKEGGIQKLLREKKNIDALKQQINYSTFFTGSTANVILITKDKIFVANCGDSRSAMYVQELNTRFSGIFSRYIQLSSDHKPDQQKQKERIKKAGGFVVNGRVNGNLSLSRAFGDFTYKKNSALDYKSQIITCHPDIKVFQRPKGHNNFIIMGCDGIWERFDDNSAGLLQIIRCDIQLGIPLNQIMRYLLNMLVSRNVIETKGKGCDNMTAIIIRFSA